MRVGIGSGSTVVYAASRLGEDWLIFIFWVL